MKLIIASNNKDKLREFNELLGNMGVELISQREAGCNFEVDETGTTFEENAYLKAHAVTEATGCAAISDDSGIAVDALGGAPGVYSARYGYGHEASDEQRNEYMLEQMKDITDMKERTARYVCCICCTFPNGDVIRSRGECEGEILFAPVGNGGFGYDPLFKPAGMDRTMAEITAAEKHAISHRGKALREFVEKFKEYTDGTDK